MLGEVELVTNSRDPEHDAARVMLARGLTGTLQLRDAETGIIRTRWNIERAAKLSVVEEDRDGLRIRKHRPSPSPRSESRKRNASGRWVARTPHGSLSAYPGATL
jgi:hypothetical protein